MLIDIERFWRSILANFLYNFVTVLIIRKRNKLI